MLVLGLQNSGLDHTQTPMVPLKLILHPDLTQMVLYLLVRTLYLLYLRLDLYQKYLLAPVPGDMSEVAAEEPQEVSVVV